MLRITNTSTSILVDFLGCEKIDEVKCLRVSAVGLKTVEPLLYEHLPSLEELDVSNNEIEELTLPTNPRITSLNCSYNNLKDVNFLYQFPGLKNLNITGNPLSIVERLIAVSFCPNLQGVDHNFVELANKLSKSYEEKFWQQILDLWNEEFAERYSPLVDAFYFAKLRQQFERKLKGKNFYLEPGYRKFEDFKLSTLVTRLMIKVRNEKTDPTDLTNFEKEDLLKGLLGTFGGSKKFCMKNFIMEMEDYEEQMLPDKINKWPQQRLASHDTITNVTNDFNKKIVINETKDKGNPKTAHDVLSTINGSNFLHSSKLIKIRFKKNGNTLESQLINEIYTSPRKLQIPLSRVEDPAVIPETPKIFTSVKNRKTQSDEQVAQPAYNETDDSDLHLSQLSSIVSDKRNVSSAQNTTTPRRNSALQNEAKKNSAKKFSDLTEKECRLTRSSSKSPMKSVGPSLQVKRKLSLDSELEEDGKSHTEEGENQQHSPLSVERKLKKRSVSVDKDPRQKKGLNSSEEEKMELIKSNLESFIKCDQGADEIILLKDTSSFSLPKTKEWQPQTFIRCHSLLNTLNDCNTQVWRCVFEPCINKPGSTSTCVATCGGNTMCVIDCSTGIIKFKYKESSTKEDFYALAWTTIELNNYQPVKANIVAVGGNLGVVHLIHPSQLACYSKMKCVSENISSLIFHHSEPTILCCGSSNGDIVLWDIGIPDYPKYETKWRKLKMIEAKTDVLNVAFTVDFDLLLAGCDNGCYGWKIMSNRKTIGKSKLNFRHPIPDDNDINNTVVDALALLPRNVVATKCAGHHCIYLWNLEATLMISSEKHSHDIQIIATLDWSKSETFFINIGVSTECCYLACGDKSGQTWIYNIDKIIKQRKLSSNVFSASDILEWPDCEIRTEDYMEKYFWDDVIINSVGFSSDGSYLVAVTNKNVVGIWK